MTPQKTYRYWRNRTIMLMRRLLDLFTDLLFGLVYRGKSERLPPITNLLLLEPAISLAAQIRARKIKCVDVVESYICRIKEIQPMLNVICDERFEKAIEEAKDADDLLQSKKYSEEELIEKFPFLGIPFTTKESIAVKGLSYTAGLVSRKGICADIDAEAVSRMRKAGAIPLAVTNVSELCMWWESNNYVYGRSNNPYDTSRIVGGSSGGEGCLLAAAGSILGVGADIGGSIRMPCFFNGVFGHKPSPGLISNHGQYPKPEGELNDYCTAGPMCRYATDLLPMFKVLVGNNASLLKLDEKVDLKKIKVYYKEDDGGNPWITRVDPELKQAQKRVLAYFTNKYKIKPKKVDLPKLKYSFQMWGYKMASAQAPSFASEMACRNGEVNCLKELVKWICWCSNFTLPAIGLGIFEKLFHKKSSRDERCSYFLSTCADLQREFQELLGEDGIFLYPPHPEPAPYHNQPLFKPFNIAYTGIFNMLGLPVTQCPLGLSKHGLPLGIQVVGGRNMDRLTIAVAVELEKSFGGWYSPSAIL